MGLPRKRTPLRSEAPTFPNRKFPEHARRSPHGRSCGTVVASGEPRYRPAVEKRAAGAAGFAGRDQTSAIISTFLPGLFLVSTAPARYSPDMPHDDAAAPATKEDIRLLMEQIGKVYDANA